MVLPHWSLREAMAVAMSRLRPQVGGRTERSTEPATTTAISSARLLERKAGPRPIELNPDGGSAITRSPCAVFDSILRLSAAGRRPKPPHEVIAGTPAVETRKRAR